MFTVPVEGDPRDFPGRTCWGVLPSAVRQSRLHHALEALCDARVHVEDHGPAAERIDDIIWELVELVDPDDLFESRDFVTGLRGWG